MKHSTGTFDGEWVCPVTGTAYHQTWTDHALPDMFNKCDQCFPDEFKPVGQRLQELNDSRR